MLIAAMINETPEMIPINEAKSNGHLYLNLTYIVIVNLINSKIYMTFNVLMEGVVCRASLRPIFVGLNTQK